MGHCRRFWGNQIGRMTLQNGLSDGHGMIQPKFVIRDDKFTLRADENIDSQCFIRVNLDIENERKS